MVFLRKQRLLWGQRSHWLAADDWSELQLVLREEGVELDEVLERRDLLF
jgi:hypothetical protein